MAYRALWAETTIAQVRDTVKRECPGTHWIDADVICVCALRASPQGQAPLPYRAGYKVSGRLESLPTSMTIDLIARIGLQNNHQTWRCSSTRMTSCSSSASGQAWCRELLRVRLPQNALQTLGNRNAQGFATKLPPTSARETFSVPI